MLFRIFGRIDDALLGPLCLIVMFGFCVYGVNRYVDLLQPPAAESQRGLAGMGMSVPERIRLLSVDQLFVSLIEHGLLRQDVDTGLIRIPYQDAWLRCRAANPALGEADSSDKIQAGRAILTALYGSIAGEEIRNAVRRWNRTQVFAAIRDNRAPVSVTSQNAVSLSPIRKSNGWRVFNSRGQLQSYQGIVPEEFGFINFHLEPGFSDWLSASSTVFSPSNTANWPDCALPGETRQGEIKFKNTFRSSVESRFDLQIIGKVKKVRLNGRDITARFDELLEPRCRRSVRAYRCAREQALALASKPGTRIRIPPGEHRLEVIVQPVISGLNRIDGLPIQRIAGVDSQNSLRWLSLPRKQQRGTYEILTSDGVRLSDEYGRGAPTRHVWGLGLTPLVGLDQGHFSSLTGILNRSVPAREHWQVHLSIDSQMQSHAIAALGETLPLLFPQNQDGSPELFSEQRRGVLLVTDIDTGAILANASFPPVPSGVHRWDHYSFLRTQSFRSPLSNMGWQNMSRHATPGSAFKLLSAMALLQSPEYGDFSGVLNGLDQNGFQRWFGSSSQYRFPVVVPGEEKPRRIGEADKIASKFAAQRRVSYEDNNGNCQWAEGSAVEQNSVTPGRNAIHLGLPEALRDSLNHWFIRMVHEMDGNKAREYDTARFAARGKIARYPQEPQFELLATARRLGLLQPRYLTGSFTTLFDKLPSDKWRDTVLFADPARISLAEKPGGLAQYPMAWVLAQNTIGQGVQLSPLHMAGLMAAVVSDRIISPYLLQVSRSDNTGKISQADPARTLGTLKLGHKRDLLMRGLKAVVDAGTARKAFANSGFIPCRVYGKTGTAQLQKSGGRSGIESFNTAWFAGFALPAAKLGEAAPRIAFACMITHAPQGQNDTGGKVCAPVVSDFLSRMDAYH